MTDKRRYSLFPKVLASVVEPLTRPVLKTKGAGLSRLLTQWPDIVGVALAAHCFPEKISFPSGKKTDGTLTIAVENGFATEIQHLQSLLIERLASYYGYKAISRIAISHSYSPQIRRKEDHKKTAALPRNIHTHAQNIDDVELKAALESLAKTLSDSQ